jgi:hypothetical protein
MAHKYRLASSKFLKLANAAVLYSSSTFLVALKTGLRVCIAVCRKSDTDVTLDLANQNMAKPAIIDYACSFTRSLEFLRNNRD